VRGGWRGTRGGGAVQLVEAIQAIEAVEMVQAVEVRQVRERQVGRWVVAQTAENPLDGGLSISRALRVAVAAAAACVVRSGAGYLASTRRVRYLERLVDEMRREAHALELGLRGVHGGRARAGLVIAAAAVRGGERRATANERANKRANAAATGRHNALLLLLDRDAGCAASRRGRGYV